MPTYKFDCGICLKMEQWHGNTIKTLKTDWKVFADQLWTLPPGLRVMECLGCGNTGIKLVQTV